MSQNLAPRPGDVWAVRTGGFFGWLIRLGTLIRYLLTGKRPIGQDVNHVVIVIKETDGVWWGIEGRPGGVGWVDLTNYITSPFTVTNYGQPKSDANRAAIITLVPQVLGTAYDWDAIMMAAATDLHLVDMFNADPTKWGTTVPGHIICSALAAWIYDHLGMKAPTEGPDTQPSDWVDFDRQHAWL